MDHYDDWTIDAYDEIDYAMAAIRENDIAEVKIPETLWTIDAYDEIDYAMSAMGENVSQDLPISERALAEYVIASESIEHNETLSDATINGSEGEDDCVIVELSEPTDNSGSRKRKANDVSSYFRVVKKMPKKFESNEKLSAGSEEESDSIGEESDSSLDYGAISIGDASENSSKDYDKSAKRIQPHNKKGHHSVMCPYGKLCEFNLRPVKARSMFSLNRHIMTAHKGLFKKQSVSMPDFFIDFGEPFVQRYLQCPVCGSFVVYRYTQHTGKCYRLSDGDLRWTNDNTRVYESSKKFQNIMNYADSSEHFDDVFGIGTWEDIKKSVYLSRVHLEIKLSLQWCSGKDNMGGKRLIYYFISSKLLKIAYVGCTVQFMRARYIRHVLQGKIDELLDAEDVRVSVFAYFVRSHVTESIFNTIKTHVESFIYVKFHGENEIQFLNDPLCINFNII